MGAVAVEPASVVRARSEPRATGQPSVFNRIGILESGRLACPDSGRSLPLPGIDYRTRHTESEIGVPCSW